MPTITRSFARAIVCLMASASLVAQGGDPPRLDMETIDGTIDELRPDGFEGCSLCQACEDCRAVHVVLRTEWRRVEVHLAPAWYLALLDYGPAVGDEVRVTGDRVRMPKGHGLAAHEVVSGLTRIKLRDEHGLPLWRRMLTEARGGPAVKTTR
jgi:hypothetical protein